jgi:hypothetical protein
MATVIGYSYQNREKIAPLPLLPKDTSSIQTEIHRGSKEACLAAIPYPIGVNVINF